jgi:ribosomal protein S11
MVSYFKINFYQLNKFLKKIIFKKIYLKKLKSRILSLIKTLKQNYKKLNNNTNTINNINFLVVYVIKICFSKTNTFIQINKAFGILKITLSAGHFLYKGKNKKARAHVLKSIIHFLIKKLDMLKNKAVVLHLKNTGFKKNWIIDKLKPKTFIKTVVGFNLYSHNGCRKKKNVSKKI